MQYLQKSEEGTRYPRTRVEDSCEPPEGSWKPNPGSLYEQPVLQTCVSSLCLLKYYVRKKGPFAGLQLSSLAVDLRIQCLEPGQGSRSLASRWPALPHLCCMCSVLVQLHFAGKECLRIHANCMSS